eukprot:TRINITY_DN63999_c0_g1_i1.p1 TRINITY_DN63999_c0_g1~~TRINITY_DN63999_c0_g1_i1.p1  ORF type:complete len:314 (+),score=43.46 TRINITY_DN63999_c0_g1_i1:32-973(+)
MSTSQQQAQAEVHRVLILGRTGAGKSTLTNFLLNEQTATTSFKLQSCTKEPTPYRGKWRGTGEVIEIIDTPGLLDSADGNMGALRALKTAADQMKDGIKALLFVQPLTDMRMDDSIKMMLELLNKVFPEQQVWDRSAIVFTHWDSLDSEKRQESVTKWVSEMPGELQSVECRLNVTNTFVYKGKHDVNSLDGLFPFIKAQTSFLPKIIHDVQQGKDGEALKIIATMHKKMMEMQLQHAQAQREIFGEIRADRERDAQRALEMQNQFMQALERSDRANAERLDKMMAQQSEQTRQLVANMPRGGGGSTRWCVVM